MYIKEFEDKVRAIEFSDSENKKVTVKEFLDDGKVSYAANFKNNEVSERQ